MTDVVVITLAVESVGLKRTGDYSVWVAFFPTDLHDLPFIIVYKVGRQAP